MPDPVCHHDSNQRRSSTRKRVQSRSSSPAPRKRLLITFIVSAPILLSMYWLVQNGSRTVALALFSVMFVVDFLLLRPKPSAPSHGPTGANRGGAARAIWVVGAACLLGSLSLLVNGVETRQTWEIVLAALGVLASGLGVNFLRWGEASSKSKP